MKDMIYQQKWARRPVFNRRGETKLATPQIHVLRRSSYAVGGTHVQLVGACAIVETKTAMPQTLFHAVPCETKLTIPKACSILYLVLIVYSILL